MARTPKRITKRNLLKVPVLIEDTVSYSKYFEVSRLDSNFHSGKNGFLIRGTQLLKQNSEIFIEVLDRNGKSVFSNIIGGYSEGSARLASIEITQKTRKGPGKLVVVGTARNYEDGRPIPANQQQAPNIRWVFPIDIDPTRRNTSKLILANPPARILGGLSVERLDFNTVSRTDSVVTSSIYTASLDYDFVGHRSDGYAIEMIDSAGAPTPFFDDVSVDGYFTGSLYKREVSNLYDSDVLVPDSQSIVLDYVTASVYTPLLKTLNETLAITGKSIKFSNGDDFLNPILRSGSYVRNVTVDSLGGNLERRLEEEITSSVIFEYLVETVDPSPAALSSIINFRIPYTNTHTGEIAKVRISAKEPNPEITAWQLLTEFLPTERNILITGSSTGNQTIGRFLEDSTLQNNWQGGLLDITDYENSQSLSSPRTLVTSSEEILEGLYVDHTESAVPYFFGTQEPFQLFQDVQYTLKYDAVYNPTYISSSTTYSTTDTGSVKAYLTRIGSDTESKNSSSVIIATQNGVENTYGLLVDEINTRDNDKSLYERQINFTAPRDGVAYPRFIVDSGFWNFSNFVITPAVEYGFNPDEIVVSAEDTIRKGTTYIFKVEFIGWAGDISDEYISDLIDIPTKGSTESVKIITNRQLFTFGSDGTPAPAEQTASIDVILTNITEAPSFTLTNNDDVPLDAQFYSASNGNINIQLYHTSFGEQTGSLNPNPTSSVILRVSASDATDIYRFNRVKDAADGTPGNPGTDGAGARAVKITLSDYSVVYDQYGDNPSPTSITASAEAQNLEGGTYKYNFFRTGSLLPNMPIVTGSLYVTASFETPEYDDYTQQNVEVQVSESDAGVARDVEDFVGVTPGKDGWSIILTNTAHTLPADNEGNVTSFIGSGTKIEVLNGANNLLPWTGSEGGALPNGHFSASVLQSSSVDQPDKTGSVVDLDLEPTYVEFADLIDMDVAPDLGSVTFEITAITGSVTTVFTKVQTFTKSTAGEDGVIYYIDTLNGTEFKTDKNGVTIPDDLYFATRRSTGSAIESLPSSSAYGLFYSGSGLAVSGSGPTDAGGASAFYTASADDILNRAELQFYSASVLVDTISVTDLTDGQDGDTAIVFSIDPATQVICRDTNDNITDPILPVVVSATEGQELLTYNAAASLNPGEWQFIEPLYGIPTQSSAVMSIDAVGGGAGGRISFDHTEIKQTGSAQFIAYAEIRYTSSLSITGSVTKSFTLTKQNCYDPCSPSVVELSSYNQTVNSIDGSLQASPSSFKAIVTQDGDQLTYQSGVSSKSTFDYLSISQSNAVGPSTDNGDGTITPNDPSTLNTSEVHTLVRYKDNCGFTATFPTTHSINVIFEGSVGPGVVVTGIWTGSQAYVTQNNESGGMRDIVLWWTPEYAATSGSVSGSTTTFNGYPLDDEDTDQYLISYYAVLKTHTSVPYDDANSGSLGPPHISTGSLSADPAWEYLGDEERFVAAKVGIFRESFIWNTLNIGTNATTQGDPSQSVKANITIHGGSKNPYLSMGQTTQEYASGGIFLGSGSVPGGPQFSLSGSTGHLLWDGGTLDVDGAISASAGRFYGSVSVEDDGKIYVGAGNYNNSDTPFYASSSFSLGNKLTWDGSTLDVSGTISASSGFFSGSLHAQTGSFAGTVTVGEEDRIRIGPGLNPASIETGSVLELDQPTVRKSGENPTPVTFSKSFNLNTGASSPISASQVSIGDLIEFRIALNDIAEGDGIGTGGEGIDKIENLTFQISQSTTHTSINLIDLLGFTIWNSGDGDIAITSSYTCVSDALVDVNLSADFTMENDDLTPDFPLFTSSLDAVIIKPSLSISNDGIFFDRGNGKESLFGLGGGSSAASPATTYTAGIGLTLSGTQFSTALEEIITADGANRVLTSDGDGTMTAEANLTFDGTDLTIAGSGTGTAGDWIATSDIRLKNVESYVSGGLIIVNNLTPIKYTWKDKNSSKLHIGLSAQEVLKYVPEAVYGSEETKYGVSYGKLVPVLIDAVKELTTRIEELENQLEDKN